MQKISSRSTDRLIPRPETQGGFLFVALTGKKDQLTNSGTRKQLRAHVMHNFRDKETKAKEKKRSPYESVDRPQTKTPLNAGLKMRFRLKGNDKLEESVPLRQRRKNADRKQDEEENIKEQQHERPAPSGPDFESWTRLSFRQEPVFEPDLQRDFQLLSFLSAENYWEDIAIRYCLTPTTTALMRMPLPASQLLPFGISRLDPLNILPFALSKRDEQLIDRFQHWEAESWCPVNGHGVWVRYAMQDELLFHATFYHWGMHFENKYSGEFHVATPEILGHKFSNFRMINERLSGGDEKVIRETFATVAAIVNVEISFGNQEEASKHMRGLETMIEIKGGIEMLKESMDGVFQRYIGWTDRNHAELFSSQTCFAEGSSHQGELYDPHPDPASHCLRKSIAGVDFGPLVRQNLQGDVISSLHRVRTLCEDVNARPFRGLQERERIRRSDELHKVERRLLNLSHMEKEYSILETPSSRMWRATALAGLMYVHHMLRMLPLAYRQFNSLSRDLQTAIALTGGAKGVWKTAPEILVWALTTGTIISAGRMEHGWYVERLASACRDIGYMSWNHYREKMKSFLWVERLDDERYRKVWDQVELLL